MTSNLQQIKLILPKLNLRELDDVILNAKVWKDKKVKGPHPIDVIEQLLYETLTEQLRIKLSEQFPTFFIFRTVRPADYALIVETAVWAESWIKVNFPDSKKVDRRRLFSLMCELIIENVEQSPAPLGLTSVLKQFKNISGYIEKAYPGYLNSGLIYLILETKYSSWPENDVNVEV
jgi:hypothetical protein